MVCCPYFFTLETMTEELLQSETTKVYDQIVANQQKVADIFINFFGEDYVDYQRPDRSYIRRQVDGFLSEDSHSTEAMVTALINDPNTVGNILVYFPKVTVTNERDNSIEITKLFVETKVTTRGSIFGQFKMTRGEYTAAQWRAGYVHSHCSYIPTDNTFAPCCLGTGPIRHTIALLSQEFDEDRWNLYCFELSEYVKVESLEGIPYIKLEGVVNSAYAPRITHLRYNLAEWYGRPRYSTVEDFWKYYVLHYDIPLSFCNGNYSLAVPPVVFFKDITSKYIDYVVTTASLNRESFLRGINISRYGLHRGVYTGNTFHDYTYCRTLNSNIENVEGGLVCYFKGQAIQRHIIDDANAQDTGREFLLDITTVNALLTRTLFVINYGTTENSHQIDKEFRIV